MNNPATDLEFLVSSFPDLNMAELASDYLRAGMEREIIGFSTPELAYEMVINKFVSEVKSVSIFRRLIDFKDGSVFDIREGSWTKYGFYPSAQSCRV